MIVVESWVAEDLGLGVSDTTRTHAGGGVLPGTQISLSSFSRAGAAGTKTSATWDPDLIASGSTESLNVTVPGAALGDFVMASFSLTLQGMTLSAEVSAANTVTATISNLSGNPIDLASGTLAVLVFNAR